MKSLASRLQQLERVVASRPAPPGPPCPKCGREIFARPRTAQDAEEEARIMRQVSPATLMEMEALLARAWAGLPEAACENCRLNAIGAVDGGLRTVMKFNEEACMRLDDATTPAGGNAAW